MAGFFAGAFAFFCLFDSQSRISGDHPGCLQILGILLDRKALHRRNLGNLKGDASSKGEMVSHLLPVLAF